MTNKEIMKALECCADHPYLCPKDCPLGNIDDCNEELMKNALDLITRQKAKIDTLYKINKGSKNEITERESGIKKVSFNRPATIVYWNDGTETVVKVQDETFDKEKGLAMAIAKKYFGNKGNYYNEFKKWIED